MLLTKVLMGARTKHRLGMISSCSTVSKTVFHSKYTSNSVSRMEVQRTEFLELLRIRFYSTATVNAYDRSIAVFYSHLAANGIDDLGAVTRETIRAYHLWLTRQRLAGSTVRLRLQSLRHFFNHLTNHATSNP